MVVVVVPDDGCWVADMASNACTVEGSTQRPCCMTLGIVDFVSWWFLGPPLCLTCSRTLPSSTACRPLRRGWFCDARLPCFWRWLPSSYDCLVPCPRSIIHMLLLQFPWQTCSDLSLDLCPSVHLWTRALEAWCLSSKLWNSLHIFCKLWHLFFKSNSGCFVLSCFIANMV